MWSIGGDDMIVLLNTREEANDQYYCKLGIAKAVSSHMFTWIQYILNEIVFYYEYVLKLM